VDARVKPGHDDFVSREFVSVEPMNDHSLHIALRRAAILCLVAGFVDAYGYMALEHVFTANMTGNTVLLGIAAAERDGGRVATYGATLIAFFAGALLASLVIRRFGKRPLVLLAVALLLGGTPLLSLEQHRELLLLTFGMGMQGSTLSRFGNTNLNTVVVTGTMLRLADEITAKLLSAVESEAKPPPGAIAIPLAGWLVYGVGAALGALFLGILAYPLLAPAALLLVVAADVARSEMVSRA
jgi:uncharacterized membrane protein YoaK (UPF0700 family)